MSLRFVRGGRAPVVLGALTIHIVADDEPLPFVVDAVVLEEDRWRALAPPKDAVAVDANPLRTTTRAMDLTPLELGSVWTETARAGQTATLRAIVIDVDADTPCMPASVTAATIAVLRHCRERRLARVRVPLLGADKGRLTHAASARALFSALTTCADERGHLEIALVVPAAARIEVQSVFE